MRLSSQTRPVPVPRDVAVVGFDDRSSLAVSLLPALSTMTRPFAEMGHWAAACLSDQLDGTAAGRTGQQAIAYTFAERASV